MNIREMRDKLFITGEAFTSLMKEITGYQMKTRRLLDIERAQLGFKSASKNSKLSAEEFKAIKETFKKLSEK